MKKLKLITIVGTRPEIIRLSRVINLLDSKANHILVHTGQNYDYELNGIFFNDLEIRKPDYFLNTAKESSSLASTIASIIEESDKIFSKVNPDAILILGDTNSSLAAIPAKRRKIPIFHMEAGNRCFDQRVPEEINRKIVDHISDINMTYSDIAKTHLVNEGLRSNYIFKVGSPMKEVLSYYERGIAKSEVLSSLRLKKYQYFLVSFHREENVDSETNLIKFNNMLNTLAEKYKIRIIVSTHPRTKKIIEKNKLIFNSLVEFVAPFGFYDFINLQINSKAVLSDSGTITEESSILNFPALNIRETHERQEGFEEGAVMLSGLEIDRVLQCLNILEEQTRGDSRTLNVVKDYDTENVSEKVVRIIHSYTDYVNSYIWKK